MVWGLLGFLGWSSLYKHKRITQGKEWCTAQGLNVKKNFMIELEIMCVNPLKFCHSSERIRVDSFTSNLI